jgi:nucleoside 2-deoxyribosyltransferase
MKKVFLSGPMRGLSRQESLGWRVLAVSQLRDDFLVVHALRGREEKETMPDQRLAIIRDKTDIDSSDIVLVNDTFSQVSMIGTAMEVIYAFMNGKIIIVFGCAHEQDYWLNYHIHARVNTLEEACQILKDFYI